MLAALNQVGDVGDSWSQDSADGSVAVSAGGEGGVAVEVGMMMDAQWFCESDWDLKKMEILCLFLACRDCKEISEQMEQRGEQEK